MIKNIFKSKKKKIPPTILLAVIMSAIGFAVKTIYTEGSLPFIIFGILNAGYLLSQLIFSLIFMKILSDFWSITIFLAFLPLVGQLLYAYLIFSIGHYFNNLNKNIQTQDNLGVDNNQLELYSMPNMRKHALSLTKELAQMRVLRSPWFLGLVIVLLSVLAGNKLLFGQSKLPIVWQRPQVTEFVLPSTSAKVNLTFRANQGINNVDLVLTPSLKDVVSISPANFPSLSAGKDYQVVLTINSSSLSQVKYSGTLHLRDATIGSTYPLPLEVVVVVHNEPVPPDPGEAGKQTLEGIDSDNDGVRDDIQRWIVTNYLNSEKRRAALTQDAKTSEIFLVDANDEELSKTHADDMQRALECGVYVFGVDEYIKASRELDAQFLNTETRSRAYLKADSQLGGTFSLVIQEDERKAQCTFDPDSMVN